MITVIIHRPVSFAYHTTIFGRIVKFSFYFPAYDAVRPDRRDPEALQYLDFKNIRDDFCIVSLVHPLQCLLRKLEQMRVVLMIFDCRIY